jgi:hypothetical protein
MSNVTASSPALNNKPRARPACGTWVCEDCGAERRYSSRFSEEPQRCPGCRSLNGHMAPAQHRRSRGRAEDHETACLAIVAEGLVPSYPLGEATRPAQPT